ncbi:MAG: hypothetical protein U0457_10635 [Candidatus Sericytochromatia bacterium]
MNNKIKFTYTLILIIFFNLISIKEIDAEEVNINKNINLIENYNNSSNNILSIDVISFEFGLNGIKLKEIEKNIYCEKMILKNRTVTGLISFFIFPLLILSYQELNKKEEGFRGSRLGGNILYALMVATFGFIIIITSSLLVGLLGFYFGDRIPIEGCNNE